MMRRVFARVALVVSLIFTFWGCSRESIPADPMAATRSLLPGKSALSGLALKDSSIVYTRANIWDRLSMVAEPYLNNGFERMAHAVYAAGADSVRIDISVFRSPLDAFAIFSWQRALPSRFVDVGAEAYLLGDTLGLIEGSHVARLIRYGDIGDDRLIAAARMVAERIQDTAALPIQLSWFPAEGKIPHHESFWLRDQEQRQEPFDFFGAMYEVEGDSMFLYFRTDSFMGIATATEFFVGQSGSIEQWLMDNGVSSMVGTHPDFGSVYYLTSGTTLVGVTGFENQSAAKQLIARFLEHLKTVSSGGQS